MGPLPPGFREHRIPIERQKFLVLTWPPRKGVDPVKPEDVINSENVEDSSYAAHPLSPPREILCAQCWPVVNRDAPVLSPFHRELVVLEVRLWWRASRPVEMKNLALAENVGAVVTDAKRNVAHQRDV